VGVEQLRARWRDGRPVRAAWLATADGLVAEMIARAGFDVLVLDMQHGMAIGPDRAAAWLQAVGNADVAALVRVPWNDPLQMQYVLDAGADGVIVPLVTSPQEAARGVGACRYPPLGYRSYGPNRAAMRAGEIDPIRWANEQVLCIALVEHRDAVERIEEIVRVPGLDGVFIGPVDLGLSMGQPPGRHDERHEAACRRVVEMARAHDKVAGIFGGGGPAEALRYTSWGFNFCPIAWDLGLIRQGAAAALEQFAVGLGSP
jgi:4-hydroxy-2-oxoheptanedioate aldolase